MPQDICYYEKEIIQYIQQLRIDEIISLSRWIFDIHISLVLIAFRLFLFIGKCYCICSQIIYWPLSGADNLIMGNRYNFMESAGLQFAQRMCNLHSNWPMVLLQFQKWTIRNRNPRIPSIMLSRKKLSTKWQSRCQKRHIVCCDFVLNIQKLEGFRIRFVSAVNDVYKGYNLQMRLISMPWIKP